MSAEAGRRLVVDWLSEPEAEAEETDGAALTFLPTFAIANLPYNVTVDTTSTWIKLTVTAAGHTITAKAAGISYPLTSTVQSGEIAIGAAGSVTDVVISVKETAKTAKFYTIHVYRA